jgi:hypothetical protein
MISPNLLDICLIFLLLFSPLETADFLMLFKPLGDGYSLLCSQKSSFRGTGNYFQSEANTFDSEKKLFLKRSCAGKLLFELHSRD